MALSLCATCARHVRIEERTCPFCRAPHEASEAPVPAEPPRRSRAALVFGALAISASATACTKDTVAQIYGAPPPPSAPPTATSAPPRASGDAGADSGTDSPLMFRERDGAPSIVAPYGAPPEPQHPDAGAKKAPQ